MKKISILFHDLYAVHLFNDPGFPSGGAAKQVLAWVKGLNAIGVKTMLMGAHDNPDFFKNNDNIIIPYKRNQGIRVLRYLYIRIPRIISGIYKSKADYVYCGISGHTTGLVALLSFLLRKKFILRIASDNEISVYRNEYPDPLRSTFTRLSFILSDYIICQNAHQYDKLIKKYPDKTYKLSNPYIGTIANNILPLNKRKYVAWVGRVSYAKNIPLLLNIARSLPDVTFKIAGNMERNSDPETAVTINKLREMPNVSFTGQLHADDILKLLSESYILLNTSHYEGFSNTYLEAFSVGTPVFAMEKAVPDNIMKKYNIGYTYKDTDDFVRAFKKLIIHKEEYEVMTSNCVNYMKKCHNLTDQSHEFLNILLNKKKLITK